MSRSSKKQISDGIEKPLTLSLFSFTLFVKRSLLFLFIFTFCGRLNKSTFKLENIKLIANLNVILLHVY